MNKLIVACMLLAPPSLSSSPKKMLKQFLFELHTQTEKIKDIHGNLYEVTTENIDGFLLKKYVLISL